MSIARPDLGAVPGVEHVRDGSARAPGPEVLAAVGLHKAYPGIKAVDGVTLTLRAGTVHGLVGANGAGKSTLLKMLTGVVKPDAGSLILDEHQVHLHGPHHARKLGIAAVHQEPSLVPGLDPVANVFLGQQMHVLGIRRRRRMVSAFTQVCTELGLDVPTTGASLGMPVAVQQQIEIIRALRHESRVLVLDEPTAALGAEERLKLHAIIRLLRSRGTAVLLISHHLEEVLELGDEITVLRAGAVVAHGEASTFTMGSLTTAMVGRSVSAVTRNRPRLPDRDKAAPALELCNIVTPGRLRIDHLCIRPGEVVGLVGLVGSGRTRLLRTIAGLEPVLGGEMLVDGRGTAWPSTPRQALTRGIALAPEDRRTQGLILRQLSWTNMTVSTIARPARCGLIRRKPAFDAAADRGAAVSLPAHRLKAAAGTLSGGNQQKVVLAKLLHARPRVLLVDEPMRGIDVGAKDEIFRVVEGAVAEGTAVLIASEETDDLLGFCDRVLVMRHGRIVATAAGAQGRDQVYAAMLLEPTPIAVKEGAS
ncbi:sugar ABC transporter ATP-binding protein [Amycolatopsis sp. NPDC049253]|uniref:sugar ABC transporter ATP-binding protein n=1 Tax=Amycolatopsis sp. NPDC049253 TaxID=3155274 RepID=UPI0034252058